MEAVLPDRAGGPFGEPGVALDENGSFDGHWGGRQHADHVPAVAAAEAEDRRRRSGRFKGDAEPRLHDLEATGERAAWAVVVLVPPDPVLHVESVPPHAGTDGHPRCPYSRRR